MKKLIALLIAAASASCTFAQSAANYSFESITSAYPVVSGTALNSNIAAGSDEIISGGISLGFTFTFCGTPYTNLKISSNGFVSPGNTLAQAAFTNDLAGSIKPVIAPLWDDLALGTAGAVVYETQGVSPNRVFIIEFKNMKWWYTATTENRSFQIRLYETTNIIEFYYNITDVPSGSVGASIGISDPTGGTGHFMSVTPGTTYTTSITTSNNQINSATYLNGKMFRFTPVSCPPPSSFMANNITHNSAVLTWTNTAATNLKYWNAPFDPLTQGVLISNATNPYFANGLLPNTTYYIYLKADCGGGITSDWSGPFIFKTLCTPVNSFPVYEGLNNAVPPDCWSESIVSSVGTPPDWYITNMGSNPVVAPYEGTNMACFNSFNCNSGSQARLASSFFNLTGTSSPVLTYQMYHDNGYDYTTGEGVQVQISLNGSNWTNIGPLNVRYNPNTGWTQAFIDLSAYIGMSVRIGFLGISQFGNNIFIDDIFIGDTPTCFPLTSVTISSVTTTSAQVSWTPSSGNSAWNYELGATGFIPDTHTEILKSTVTIPAVNLSPLSPQTSYDLYIQSDCGTNGLSTWAGPFIVTTACLPQTILPYTESFDPGYLPDCWNVSHNSSYTGYFDWFIVPNDPNGAPSGYDGTGNFAMLDCFNAPVAGSPYNLDSKQILIPANFYKLRYYYWIGSGYSLTTPIIVKISDDNGITWNTVYSHDMSTVDQWAYNEVSLSAYAGQTIIVRFEGYSDWGFGLNNFGIDQFEISADKALLYSSYEFNESYYNDGSITDTIGFKLYGDLFASTGALTEGVDYIVTNIPAGLISELYVLQPDSAVFYLTGAAASHANIDDINDLGLEFLDAAFTGNIASTINNYKVDTISINFVDFLVINEVDADQSGSDTYEFIELFDGGTGNLPLDGYCLVLYNGGTDASYNSWDLDGFATNSDGYFVIGTPNIPSASLIIPGNSIQNGQDAIAVFEGNSADFPVGTIVKSTGITDAVVYDNGQADDPALLAMIAQGQPQIDENEFGMGQLYSFQRIPNGSGGMKHSITFKVAPPTPGTVNEPAPILVWPSDSFYESLADDGSIETVMNLILKNDTFNTSGLLQEAIHYNSFNMPAGLQFQVSVINDTTLEISISGNAILHSPPDNISDLSISFADTCYSKYSSQLIMNSNRDDLDIIYTYAVNISEINEQEIIIYPNPANEYLVIYTPVYTDNGQANIFDISGRLINNIDLSGNKTIADISKLSPGTYIIRVFDEQKILIIY